MWQDTVLGCGQLIFAAVALRMLADRKTRIPRLSSVTTSTLLALFAATNWTVGLHFHASVTLVVSLLWAGIALYRPVRPEPIFVTRSSGQSRR